MKTTLIKYYLDVVVVVISEDPMKVFYASPISKAKDFCFTPVFLFSLVFNLSYYKYHIGKFLLKSICESVN